MPTVKQKLLKKTYVHGNLTLSTMNRRFTFFQINRGNETVGIVSLANFMIEQFPYKQALINFYSQNIKASLFISSSLPEEEKIDCVQILCDFLNDNNMTLHYICEVDNINKKSKKKEFKSDLNENNTSPYYVLENFSHIYIGENKKVHFCSKEKVKMLHDNDIDYTIRESHKAPHFIMPNDNIKDNDKRYLYINRSDYLKDYSIETHKRINTTKTNMRIYIDSNKFIDNGPIILPRYHYDQSKEGGHKIGIIRILDIKDGSFISHPIDLSNIEMKSGDVFVQRLKLSINDFMTSLDHIKDKFDCYIPVMNRGSGYYFASYNAYINYRTGETHKKEWIQMVYDNVFSNEDYKLIKPEEFFDVHEKTHKKIIFTSPVYNKNKESKEGIEYIKDIYSSDDCLIEMPIVCKKK